MRPPITDTGLGFVDTREPARGVIVCHGAPFVERFDDKTQARENFYPSDLGLWSG